MMRFLASDNNAGVDPRILEALAAANQGHAVGYGADKWTRQMETAFADVFGAESQAFAVINGTGANVLSLSAMLGPFDAVICSRVSHLYVDECGAPERFLGAKLIPVEHVDGKISVAEIARELQPPDDEHRVQPSVVSITQPTELGTLYSLAEIREISEFCRAHNLYLHLDGARIANAAVALGVSFSELTEGVDVISFGGTKNGLIFGEAVVFRRPELAKRFKFLRKQGMQLLSKMRFVSAQLTAYLEQQIWSENAAHANTMAQLLAEGIKTIPEVELAFPVQTNAVFARLPLALIKPLQEQCYFYVWRDDPDQDRPIVRWMTSFDTESQDIEAFIQALKKLTGRL